MAALSLNKRQLVISILFGIFLVLVRYHFDSKANSATPIVSAKINTFPNPLHAFKELLSRFQTKPVVVIKPWHAVFFDTVTNSSFQESYNAYPTFFNWVVVILAASLFVSPGYNLTRGFVIVYGTNGCPWCNKQKSYLFSKGIPYLYLNCAYFPCPSYVKAFPTLNVNGVTTSGYSEL